MASFSETARLYVNGARDFVGGAVQNEIFVLRNRKSELVFRREHVPEVSDAVVDALQLDGNIASHRRGSPLDTGYRPGLVFEVIQWCSSEGEKYEMQLRATGKQVAIRLSTGSDVIPFRGLVAQGLLTEELNTEAVFHYRNTMSLVDRAMLGVVLAKPISQKSR